ncbi:16S rRNA (cytosine(1402)-N(4))-methyltransferase RsmH [Bifidobacterium gallicum]|uniref:Ribosomal RNA small subunit methyltransferase H n=1 Tax=Bifidobacterium gallicum DSM 20093 = LMG 11596 TaxID=561180 RepID=D1NSW3_9BIFI|nr:16S rRNA (cytosine(1402)-N(4))-methyltransferase RsmH [Bifidobacterium gallicum]EFA23765.1 S-adenosyl-methyltransferase MraW [Bifidobacterium gallicum DSM 20093 = LMG 11596]KFI59222.1 16S rRNA methyltransferase [Bifidobacterium gallicum DSM 20093 = LMG 11596]
MDHITQIHQPVLLEQCVDLVVPALNAPGSVVVDCTLGLAGHATAFLKAAPNATLLGIDRDAEALALATQRMEHEGLADRFIAVHAAFDDFGQAVDAHGLGPVQAVFMDLGLSSLQIDETERGFSYSHDAPLDMRMDTTQPLTAQTILATYDEASLARIFKDYGEERFARQIARRIVSTRNREPLTTSAQLNRLVDAVIPQAHRASGNPAKRVFQALRIEVNGELDKLRRTLPQIANRLAVGGRLVVESYHSLEDRTVKTFMQQGLSIDVPADMPVIPDDAQPFFSALTKGALKADAEEIEHNPRSASVRLRAVELIRPVPQRWRKTFNDEASGFVDDTSYRHARSSRGRRSGHRRG